MPPIYNHICILKQKFNIPFVTMKKISKILLIFHKNWYSLKIQPSDLKNYWLVSLNKKSHSTYIDVFYLKHVMQYCNFSHKFTRVWSNPINSDWHKFETMKQSHLLNNSSLLDILKVYTIASLYLFSPLDLSARGLFLIKFFASTGFSVT